MPPSPRPSRARSPGRQLTFLEPGGAGAENPVGDPIKFQFNPDDLQHDQGRQVAAELDQGRASCRRSTTDRCRPASRSRCSSTRPTRRRGDISKTVKSILDKVNPDPKSIGKEQAFGALRPLQWGQKIMFTGYIAQAAVEYTLFRESGDPGARHGDAHAQRVRHGGEGAEPDVRRGAGLAGPPRRRRRHPRLDRLSTSTARPPTGADRQRQLVHLRSAAAPCPARRSSSRRRSDDQRRPHHAVPGAHQQQDGACRPPSTASSSSSRSRAPTTAPTSAW